MYMGNTSTLHHLGQRVGEYPRVYGEYSPIGLCGEVKSGISPRIWGILPGPLFVPLAGRNIPAYMGNTLLLFTTLFRIPLHTDFTASQAIAVNGLI